MNANGGIAEIIDIPSSVEFKSNRLGIKAGVFSKIHSFGSGVVLAAEIGSGINFVTIEEESKMTRMIYENDNLISEEESSAALSFSKTIPS